MSKTETIIIGGGMAGLGCARRLHNHGRDFFMITENIGGRVCFKDQVSFGALLVGQNYKHVSKIVTKTAPVKIGDFQIYQSGEAIGSWGFLNKPLEAIRFYCEVKKFKRAYFVFQERCEKISQKEAIKKDPYLKNLYFQPAQEFIKEKNFFHTTKHYLEPALYGITGIKIDQASAFLFMLISLGAFVKSYLFYFDEQATIKGMRDRVVFDSVVSIEKSTRGYRATTRTGEEYEAINAVVATPALVSQKLLHLPEVKSGPDVYVFHVRGEIKPHFKKGREKIFDSDSEVMFIHHSKKDFYTTYAVIPKPDLNKFFHSYTIIKKKHWSPIYPVIGNVLLDAEQDKNLWLAGDHNILGMEDAYLTGLYAASQIIKNN